MLQPVSDCAMILGHNVDTEGRCIKFVLFYKWILFFNEKSRRMEIKGKLQPPV